MGPYNTFLDQTYMMTICPGQEYPKPNVMRMNEAEIRARYLQTGEILCILSTIHYLYL